MLSAPPPGCSRSCPSMLPSLHPTSQLLPSPVSPSGPGPPLGQPGPEATRNCRWPLPSRRRAPLQRGRASRPQGRCTRNRGLGDPSMPENLSSSGASQLLPEAALGGGMSLCSGSGAWSWRSPGSLPPQHRIPHAGTPASALGVWRASWPRWRRRRLPGWEPVGPFISASAPQAKETRKGVHQANTGRCRETCAHPAETAEDQRVHGESSAGGREESRLLQ